MPRLILALLPIAMDPSSSAELQTSIVVTIDILGGSIPSTSDGFSPLVRSVLPHVFVLYTQSLSQEPQICSKVLTYAADFTPANKAYLLSFFCGGSLQTARIARWLARRMILVEESPTEVCIPHVEACCGPDDSPRSTLPIRP